MPTITANRSPQREVLYYWDLEGEHLHVDVERTLDERLARLLDRQLAREFAAVRQARTGDVRVRLAHAALRCTNPYPRRCDVDPDTLAADFPLVAQVCEARRAEVPGLHDHLDRLPRY